ncbi:Gfo/Idh/MocA family oxidoreductase [soil metagenome]
MSNLSRRSFLKQSTAAAGAILSLPAISYRAAFAAEPPSERVRTAMIGVGNQGGPNNNMKYFLKNIVAMCDLDKNYLDRGEAFLQKEASLKAMLTDDYRKVLDSKDVDAVVITVPDQWHCKMTVEACLAGKDVYCEKPLTLVIGEGKTMIDAARKHKRVVQTGSMQRSGTEFITAVDLVKKGAVGKVKDANVTLPSPNWVARAVGGKPVPDSAPPAGFDFDRWLGPAPLKPYNVNHVHYLFRFYWDYSGGQQTNFGAHHLDIAQWGLGMDDSGPVSVEGTAVFNPDGWYETPDTTEIKYTYANGVVMTARQKFKTTGTTQGTEFIGDKGSLFVHRGGINVSDKSIMGGATLPKIGGNQANFAHVSNFYDCVKSRKAPNADISIGHRSATVCHLGNIAVRTKKKIAWDPKTETIVGDADAAKWLTKEYRKGYTLG